MFVTLGGDEEKFKALCIVHTILSSEESRKLYDETGEIDGDGDEMMNSKSFDEWYQYFRQLFPKLTEAAIDEFSLQYKDSEEERRDILHAYSEHAGSMQGILDTVMLLEAGEEGRVLAVVDGAIAAGEVTSFPAYATFRAAHLATHPILVLTTSAAAAGGGGGNRKKGSASTGGGKGEKNKSASGKSDGGDLSLEAMILARKQSTDALYDSLLDKYSKKPGGGKKTKHAKAKEPAAFQDIPDDVFNKLREKVTKSSDASSSSSHKKQKK